VQEFWKTFENKIDISEDVKDLLVHMFAFNPSARYTLEQIVAHPWYQMMVQGAAEDGRVQIDKREREAKHTRAGLPHSPE
jgi:serine/threonine protein kinase